MFPFGMAKKYKLDRLIYMTGFASREREREKSTMQFYMKRVNYYPTSLSHLYKV